MSLSHFCLCGTSIWALKQTPKQYKWAYGTYTFLAAYGLLGILTTCEGRLFDSILLRNATLVAEIIPMPFINAELYKINNNCNKKIIQQQKINNNYYNANQNDDDDDLSLIHCLTATIPLAIKFFANEDNNTDMMNLIFGSNLASIIYYSITYENAWGLILAASHFLFTRMQSITDEPKFNLFSIGLCFFNIFSCNAIKLSKRQKEQQEREQENE